MLGLERLLSEEEPKLADGTVLSAHQVDALSGTLTALLAEAQRGANGKAARGGGAGAARRRRRSSGSTRSRRGPDGRPASNGAPAPPGWTAGSE